MTPQITSSSLLSAAVCCFYSLFPTIVGIDKADMAFVFGSNEKLHIKSGTSLLVTLTKAA